MMDFVSINWRKEKDGSVTVYPEFLVDLHHEDLMIKGGSFYAVWDEKEGLWSKKEGKVKQLVDDAVWEKKKELEQKTDDPLKVQLMKNFSSHKWSEWKAYTKASPDDYEELDSKVIFSNTNVKKSDYASKRLPYPLEEGDIGAYDELMSTLYDPDNREKLEWAIGSIISGDAKKIQKFIVLYGSGGTGKSTVLNIIKMLFDGYYCVFESKALGTGTSEFALDAFKNNPLVAIDTEGELSRIADNTKLNSITAHESLMINEKYKTPYLSNFNAFLFIATNKPVRITDAKSGLIRRLIDVRPTGNLVSQRRYDILMEQIRFELGAIASHCLKVYQDLGKHFYDTYSPVEMIGATNDFYNFVEDSYDVFKADEGITLKQAWAMYKEYCEEARVDFPYSLRQFREELKNYFKEYYDRYTDGKDRIRSYYIGFLKDKFYYQTQEVAEEKPLNLSLDSEESLFDEFAADFPAQYEIDDGKRIRPEHKWPNCKTKLKDLDTKRVHYVLLPENYIFIDFDLKDENGEKSLEKNLEAASKWPPTYAEFSKSGKGIHLYYIYNGDVSNLAQEYDKNIEIKTCGPNKPVRRALSWCNTVAIALFSGILPQKKEKKVLSGEIVKNEKYIRKQIINALMKKVHPDTTSNIHWIAKVLDDAFKSGVKYDVTDLRDNVRSFAQNASNQSDHCLEEYSKMHFTSEVLPAPIIDFIDDENESISTVDLINLPYSDLTFVDVEVFPNGNCACFKPFGEDKPVVKWKNPDRKQISWLLKQYLVTFNGRRYDNHILYALYLGYEPQKVYDLSQEIINGKDKQNKPFFKAAYSVSYTDVYDFASEKKSLKKWEMDLGIYHLENQYPWDEDLPDDKWEEVMNYCANDVIATEKVFLACEGDFVARKVLAEIAGLTPNDTTNTLTTRFIFGSDRNPQLIYTNLTTGEQDPPGLYPSKYINSWPEYEFVDGKNMYKGVDVSKGGLVISSPGAYFNVWTFDSVSHHPHSAIAMNYFGKYTSRFKEILDARVALKHGDFDTARTLLDGKLAKYLEDTSDKKMIKNLIRALKIAINSVYGLTSASFKNPFKHPKNVNNIVALRGALFMYDLKEFVEGLGYTVIHIKTDSIKVVDGSYELLEKINKYAEDYGYEFEVEHIFESICLVDKANYIAKLAENDPESPGIWSPTGDKFKIPYVFKTLFSKEEIVFDDLCETKSVSSAMYLDFNEGLPEGEHNYKFVGKVGRFSPVLKGTGGGELVRLQDGKYYKVEGSSDFRWKESSVIKELGLEEDIDLGYFLRLVRDAENAIKLVCRSDVFYRRLEPNYGIHHTSNLMIND